MGEISSVRSLHFTNQFGFIDRYTMNLQNWARQRTYSGHDEFIMSTFSKPELLPLTEVFIETGTHLGESLAAALETGYQRCLSVEYVEALYEAARKRFCGNPRVQLYHGSSPELLPHMIDPSKSTTFWLDAHFAGTDQGWQDPRYGECPLLEELRVINSIHWTAAPIVCIDDAFIFHDANWLAPSDVFAPASFTRSHWPRRVDIERLLSGYVMSEHNYALFCTPMSGGG